MMFEKMQGRLLNSIKYFFYIIFAFIAVHVFFFNQFKILYVFKPSYAIGTCLYTGLNYFGQRFFAFK